MKKFSLLITLLLALSACGDKKENPVVSIPAKKTQNLSEVSNNIIVDSSVPKHVGQIVFLDEKEISTCTGSIVIDKKTLLTNRHCIPDKVVANPSLCGDRFHVAFFDGNKTIVRKCAKLIEHSKRAEYKVHESDYALIELDQEVEATPLKIDIAGVPSDSPIDIYSVNLYTRDGYYESNLRFNQCVTKYVPFFEYTHAYSYNNIMFGITSNIDCDVISGNSGSAMIDSRTGKAVGVVFAIIDEDTKSRLDPNNFLHVMLKYAMKNTKKVAKGFPLALVPYFNPAGASLAGIKDGEVLLEEQMMKAFNENVFGGDDHTASLKYISMEDDDKTLELFRGGNGISVHFRPKCIEKEYAKEEIPNKIKIIEFKTPGLKLDFNHYMVPSVSISSAIATDYKSAEGVLGEDQDGLYIEYSDFNHPTGQLKKLRRCPE